MAARHIAEKAVEVGRASGLTVEVFNRDQLAEMGCGGMLGVNAGSTEPPRMVRLTYTPAQPGRSPRDGGQGRDVRFRWSQPEAQRRHDHDEDGHERRRRRAVHDERAEGAAVQGEGHRVT